MRLSYAVLAGGAESESLELFACASTLRIIAKLALCMGLLASNGSTESSISTIFLVATGRRRGKSDSQPCHRAVPHPFLFGLVHGFGFSNVLREKQLHGVIWLSLFSLNTGVEIGQLIFVVLLFPLIEDLNSSGWNKSGPVVSPRVARIRRPSRAARLPYK